MSNVIEIVIKQSGSGHAIADVQKQLGDLGNAASGTTGFLGKLAGGLGGVATVAGGIVAANLFSRIAEGVSNFVSTGLDAVGSSQQLEASLKALLTSNNMYTQVTETTTQAITNQIMSQDELGIKYDELAAHLATQRATYQEQQERIRQLTDQYGENGLAVIEARAQHNELALKIKATEREISGLTASETTYATVTKTAWQETMSQADAFKIASAQSRDLLDFVSRLAVVSPFETETVELTTKYAVAAGLGLDATKEFVPAFLDLAGAVGISSDELGFAADQLFQVKKIGKLTEIDLRQLRRLGIDLGKVIGVEMGMSVEEFNAKAAKSPEIFDELFGAITNFSKNTFAGTAKEMALSVKGLQSTFSDIFVIGSRTFLRPLVDAMTPTVAAIASSLSDFVLGGRMAEIGQQAAELFMSGLSKFNAISSAFGRSWDEGFRMLIYKTVPIFEGLWATVQPVLMGWVDNITAFLVVSWPIIQTQLLAWRDQFFDWVTALYPQIPGILSRLTANIAASLDSNWPIISAKLSEWAVMFWDWVGTAAANAGTAMQAIALALITWATSTEAQTAMQDLGRNLGVMLTDAMKLNLEGGEGISSVITSLITGLASVVASAIGSLIILGGELVAGIVSGVLTELGVNLKPTTFNALGGILTGIGRDIVTIAGYVGTQIVIGILSGFNAHVAIITEGFAKGVEAWTKIITETDWFELGSSIIDGIMKGIEKSQDKVFEVLKDMALKALATAKAAVGYGSPAARFIPLGQSIVQGLTAGVTSESPTFINAMMRLLNPNSIMANALVAQGQRHDIANLMSNIAPQFMSQLGAGALNLGQAIQSGLSAIGSQVSVGQVIDAMERFGFTIGDITAQIQDTYNETEKLMRLQNAFQAVGVASQFVNLGQTAAQRLADQVDILTKIVESGEAGLFQGQIVDAVDAQLLLNDALADQASIQQQIVDLQRQQADLQWLQQQISLIQMVKDAGLDVQDILGGITFGLNASIPDIVTAMNNVVQAMINQIDSDLAIQSPSKVMIDRMRQVGGGMVRGLMAAKPMVEQAVGSLFEPLTGGRNGSSTSRVTNNYFNQTVNTRADSSTVIGDFNVMRGLIGA